MSFLHLLSHIPPDLLLCKMPFLLSKAVETEIMISFTFILIKWNYKRPTNWNLLCFKVYHFLTWSDQCHFLIIHWLEATRVPEEKKILFLLLYLNIGGGREGGCFIYFCNELFSVKNKISKSKSHNSDNLCKISVFKWNQNSPLG